MSSLLSSSYIKILGYWNDRLTNSKFKFKFLITKLIEIYTFKHNSEKRELKFEESKVFYNSNFQHTINHNPIISVVVPVYIRNSFDCDCADRLINCLNNQNRKTDNIIFVDDCSPIQYDFSKFVISYKLTENKGPAKARNKGIEIAKQQNSDIIVFTDLDCVPDINWIQNIELKFLNDKECHILSGLALSHNKNWFGKYHEINGTLNGRKFINSDLLLYGTTCNLAVLKDVVYQVNFNESFPNAAGEDIEFCFRAAQKGFNIKHCNKSIIYHDYGYNGNLIVNIQKFRRQFSKYGNGEKILLEKIPDYYTYFDNTLEIPSIDYN